MDDIALTGYGLLAFRMDGRVRLEFDDAACHELTIEGEMDGGRADESVAVLDELVRLLGAALDADQLLDG